MGECTVEIRMSELSVVITYKVVVHDIEEDLVLDVTMMHYTGI